VWYSADTGATWTQTAAAVTGQSWSSIAMSGCGNHIYASSFGTLGPGYVFATATGEAACNLVSPISAAPAAQQSPSGSQSAQQVIIPGVSFESSLAVVIAAPLVALTAIVVLYRRYRMRDASHTETFLHEHNGFVEI
jgi:hypothetical protein